MFKYKYGCQFFVLNLVMRESIHRYFQIIVSFKIMFFEILYKFDFNDQFNEMDSKINAIEENMKLSPRKISMMMASKIFIGQHYNIFQRKNML